MEKVLLLESNSYQRDLSFYEKFAPKEKGKISKHYKFDSIYQYTYNNCYVSPFGLVFKNGFIIKESQYRDFGLSLLRQTPSFYKKIILKNVVKINDNCVVAHHSWYDNYYHWLIEIMPRLYLLKDKAEQLSLLIHTNIKPFHKELINLFNFKKVVFIKDNELALVDTVSFPSFNHSDKESDLTTDFSSPAMNKQLMKDVGSWIVSKTQDLTVKKYSKIYISRNKAMHRRVLNEDEVVGYLSSIGFTILYFEDYELREQVNFIHHADVVVGVCGAGLSNILFMKKGARVLNLIHKDVHEFCFYNLANCVEVNYTHFVCEGNHKANAAFNDITVNIEDLKKSLDL